MSELTEPDCRFSEMVLPTTLSYTVTVFSRYKLWLETCDADDDLCNAFLYYSYDIGVKHDVRLPYGLLLPLLLQLLLL